MVKLRWESTKARGSFIFIFYVHWFAFHLWSLKLHWLHPTWRFMSQNTSHQVWWVRASTGSSFWPRWNVPHHMNCMLLNTVTEDGVKGLMRKIKADCQRLASLLLPTCFFFVFLGGGFPPLFGQHDGDVLPASAWVVSGYFGFLPQSRDM